MNTDIKQVDETQESASAPKQETPAPQNSGVQVDKSALELLDPDNVERPKQVQDPLVIFVPHKDFQARVNQQEFSFRKDVPTRVTRDIANMLLEDRERGYIRD